VEEKQEKHANVEELQEYDSILEAFQGKTKDSEKVVIFN
jgi:hypothetical protein